MIMSAARTTAKKHSAPSASATAARLGGYLTVSLGAGVLGTSQADAGIVSIDIGPTGFNIGSPNAGVSTGNTAYRADFPFSNAGYLYLVNKQTYQPDIAIVTVTGLYGRNGLQFANNGGALATKFAADATIDGSSGFSSSGNGSQGLFYYKNGILSPSVSPDFGPGSYVGFMTNQGNYGWLEVTWSSSSEQFQILSGAYESVPGVAITAGPVVVPEPSTTALLGLGALALGAGAVRKQRTARRAQAAAAESA